MKLEREALDDTVSKPVSFIGMPESDLTRRLRAGREKVAKGWCRNSLWLEIDGKTHFCARGALMPVGRWQPDCEGEAALYAQLPTEWRTQWAVTHGELMGDAVAHYNNAHSQHNVLDLFDAAIAAEVARGA